MTTTQDNSSTGETTHILCVCTAGQQRSPTCADLVNQLAGFEGKYAGILSYDKPVNQTAIDWADYIIAMDEDVDSHKTYLETKLELGEKPVTVLGIPDRFTKNDPKLMQLLKEKLAATLGVEQTEFDS